jgi:uncharacterized membrane protein
MPAPEVHITFYFHMLIFMFHEAGEVRGGKVRNKSKHSDAVMTGILVTKFKMGQINVEDLE